MHIPIRFRQAAAATGAVIALSLFACHGPEGEAPRAAESGDLGTVQAVMRLIEQRYVEPVPQDKLVNNALKGMLTSLDPHSDYMDERAYRQMRSDTRGEFGGVGIQLTVEKSLPMVIAPIDDTPASKAGIDPGDIIVKVDDRPTVGLSLEEVAARVRGPVGSTVRLQIARANREPFDVTLVRSVIRIATVKSQLEKDKAGYIRISVFSKTTADDFEAAIKSLKQKAGGRLTGLVLDLRNDPGGLLETAVDVANDMLDGGTVLTVQGRDGGDRQVYAARADGDLLRGTPIVVLINGASASASEIVAGALQDRHRATVIGNRSFGKGSVQTIIPLGGRGAIRLTTARYYTPSGRSIQDRGITPDIVVGVPADAQVPNAVVIREADLARALKNTGALDGTAPDKTAATAQPADADAAPIKSTLIGTDKDPQLAAALAYLQGGARAGTAPR